MAKSTLDIDSIAKNIISAIESFLAQESISLTKDPEYKERDIIEYDSRMRTFGLEKFNGPCYISVAPFYRSEQKQKEKDPEGIILFYLNQEIAARLFKLMEIRGFDEDDPESMMEHCGQFAEKMLEVLKPKFNSFNLSSMISGKIQNFANDAAQGVEFPYAQYQYCEVSFDFWKKKALVISATFAGN